MPSEANHIDNCSYVCMQAHLVFYDMGFDSIKKAKPAKDGLVVLAVMIKVLFKDLTKEHVHMSDSRK